MKGEWEEEEPGEDLVSEADDEPAEKEDEEEQDGWLVPHGYLSDGEGGVDSGDEKKPKVEPKARKLVPLVQVLIGPYQTAGYNYSKIEKFFGIQNFDIQKWYIRSKPKMNQQKYPERRRKDLLFQIPCFQS